MDKPDCHKCKHRGSIPGDVHIRCEHPDALSPFSYIILMAQMKLGNIPNDLQKYNKLNIRGNKIGINGGWFMWPVNFDPNWLENCEGFEKNV